MSVVACTVQVNAGMVLELMRMDKLSLYLWILPGWGGFQTSVLSTCMRGCARPVLWWTVAVGEDAVPMIWGCIKSPLGSKIPSKQPHCQLSSSTGDMHEDAYLHSILLMSLITSNVCGGSVRAF